MSKALNWEYCECGCHTSDLDLAGAHYSHLMYWPLAKDNQQIVLHEGGHLNGKRLGTFKNWAELDAFMLTLAEERLKVLQKAVRELRKEIKAKKA
jgi:hypothetical protein